MSKMKTVNFYKTHTRKTLEASRSLCTETTEETVVYLYTQEKGLLLYSSSGVVKGVCNVFNCIPLIFQR